MKPLSNYFRTLILAGFFIFVNTVWSQSPCTSSFIYSVNPGGNVTFSSVSTTTGTGTVYNWQVFNNSFTSLGSMNGLNPSFTFSVNGTYSVSLQIINNAPSCSAISSQTFVITNTNTPCSLNADFTVTQGSNGAVVLNNTSTGTGGSTVYSWNFGDNSTGAAVSPPHTYSANGVYTVTLTANNNFTYACSSTIVKNVQVCSIAPFMNPSFVYSINSGGNVSFTSTSTGTNSSTFYIWNHNILGITSSGQNLVQTAVTYSLNGYYWTQLTILNPLTTCSVSTTQTVVITNTTCALSASFQATPLANGNVSFSNQSAGTYSGTIYSWNFGDNTTSSLSTPTHSYSSNGQYTVTLTAVNNYSIPCTAVSTQTVLVCSVQPSINASFLATPGAGGNITVTSTATGTLPTSVFHWLFFGVGSANLYNVNWPLSGTGTYSSGIGLTQAAITYTTNGAKIVVMEIIDAATTCTYSSLQTITITTVPPCVANAGFSLSPSGIPQLWNAMPLSPGNVTAATWNWGDNSSSNTLFTSHTYSVAGMYSICLSVTISCGATDMYCNSYSIFKSQVGGLNQDVIQVNVIDPATVGISEKIEMSSLDAMLFPNPANGLFRISMKNLPQPETGISVYDINGKDIYTGHLTAINGSLTTEINLQDSPCGIYFLKARSGEKIFSKRIVIEK